MGNAPSSRSASSSVETVIMTVAPSGSACMAWRKRARLRAAVAFQRATRKRKGAPSFRAGVVEVRQDA